jgi:glucosamine--fructose-6-phosphate aminotransferase (isomerizing)
MGSVLRETIWRQPADLRGLLADTEPVAAAAERLRGRRLVIVGTGTSWHAANHGVWLLREAGVDAVAVQAMDAALWGPWPAPGEALLIMSHRNTKRFSSVVLERARAEGVPTVVISGVGSQGADVETVQQERSATFTASHTGALMRLAQLARELGAELAGLERVPDAIQRVLDAPSTGVRPPDRLLELTGAGPNQWTAAEGALKIREAARVVTEGLAVEQLFHGPSVALGEGCALVCLDGGGPGAERLEAVAAAAEATDVAVTRISERELGEPLSVFPLTVHVQRIALELAEELGTDPDAFGYDVPGRAEAWKPLQL